MEEKNNDKNVVSIIGLIIFFIFVVVLAVVSRTNKSDGKSALEEFTEKNSKSNPIEEKMEEAKNNSKATTIFDELKDNSYEFIYTIEDNGNKTIYSGKKKNNKMVIDVINNGSKRYYQVGEVIFLDQDFKSISSIPLEYEKFINFDKLNKLYSYSITGENGKRDVSVYDIYDIYYLDFLYDPFDIEDIEDSTIEVKMADGYVSKVVLDFTTALSYMNQKDYSFIVTMEFSNIGRVEDINIG